MATTRDGITEERAQRQTTSLGRHQWAKVEAGQSEAILEEEDLQHGESAADQTQRAERQERCLAER